MPDQPNMQSNLAFVEGQLAHVEEQVYTIEYEDIQYPDLVPIDTSADEWADTVLYYSMDGYGKAGWIGDKVSDIPLVSQAMAQHHTAVELAGIGYDYGLVEVQRARRLGMNLETDKAQLARRVSEEEIDRVALYGDAIKGFSGLTSYPGVPVTAAPNGASGSPNWSQKTGDEIVADANKLIVGVYTGTRRRSLADTLLLPTDQLQLLATRTIEGTAITLYQHLMENNLYTMRTGRELTIRDVSGLESAGAGGTARAVAYANQERALKMHVPMPLDFLDVQIVGLRYIVPGVFRIGGLDWRLPLEGAYLDGI